ncbi:Tagatose-6-phosphate kinase [Lactococcus formosensis]|nr:Tagatose-6-phosphate kinase [Lactococcus formosensis]
MIYTVTLNPALDYFMDFDQAELGQVNRASETRMLPGGKGLSKVV